MISAVVLTRNEKNLPAGRQGAHKCLESLRWCDEVLVLENEHLTDYAAQRNLGLEKAKNEWVLFVDDDEVVSEELRDEILSLRSRMTREVDGYYIKRLDYFGGKFLKFGETGNIKLLRFGKKGAGRWYRKVHEVWDIKNTATLKNPLYHYPHPTIAGFVASVNEYTSLDTSELRKEGKNFSVFRMIFNPVGKFVQNYIFKLGFLDGFPGFVMAYMMSFYSLIVRVKLYENALR